MQDWAALDLMGTAKDPKDTQEIMAASQPHVVQMDVDAIVSYSYKLCEYMSCSDCSECIRIIECCPGLGVDLVSVRTFVQWLSKSSDN